ncbi:MAG: hypothetical protein R3301_19860 [Saprospiraceae bacterium]|nr:hypothetical protein [Saprospiraceae bacterium]
MKTILILLLCVSFIRGLAQDDLTISLRANYAIEDTIQAGDPLILHITAYDPVAEHAVYHNEIVGRNLADLERDRAAGVIDETTYQARKAELDSSMQQIVPSQVPEALRAGIVRFRLDGRDMPSSAILKCSDPGDPVPEVLTSGERVNWIFGIPPEITRSWRAGMHNLVVFADSLRSNVVTIVVAAATPRGKVTEQQLDLGYFFLDCNLVDDAATVSDALLRTTPQSIDATILRAEVLLAQRDTVQSRQLFERALEMFYQQYPDSYEPPEYLLGRLDLLERNQDE